jgi:hypothetical protein
LYKHFNSINASRCTLLCFLEKDKIITGQFIQHNYEYVPHIFFMKMATTYPNLATWHSPEMSLLPHCGGAPGALGHQTRFTSTRGWPARTVV